MKAITINTSTNFRPIEVALTLETQDEVNSLMNIYSVQSITCLDKTTTKEDHEVLTRLLEVIRRVISQ